LPSKWEKGTTNSIEYTILEEDDDDAISAIQKHPKVPLTSEL